MRGVTDICHLLFSHFAIFTRPLTYIALADTPSALHMICCPSDTTRTRVLIYSTVRRTVGMTRVPFHLYLCRPASHRQSTNTVGKVYRCPFRGYLKWKPKPKNIPRWFRMPAEFRRALDEEPCFQCSTEPVDHWRRRAVLPMLYGTRTILDNEEPCFQCCTGDTPTRSSSGVK